MARATVTGLQESMMLMQMNLNIESTPSRSPAVFLLDVCERGTAACLYLGRLQKRSPAFLPAHL